MFKFSIKSLLVLITLVALCVALVLSRLQLSKATEELKTQQARAKTDLDALKAEYNALNVSDPTRIKAVAMPRLLGFNMWQWRVYMPPGQRFRIRTAYDKQSSLSGEPNIVRGKSTHELQSGESILSVALNNTNGHWQLNIGSDAEDQLMSTTSPVRSSDTKWLDEGRIGAMVTGNNKGGSEGDPVKPFLLLRLLDTTPQAEGVTPAWRAMMWIEEVPEAKNGR